MSSPVERKDFTASKKLRDVMGQYFTSLDRGGAEGKKTAWCTSVGPAELLLALGFNVYFPENHGAMLGASRMATELIPLANARGFSPDICSYLTSDVGAYLKGVSPLQFYAREWNVPCVGIQTPRSIGAVDGALVDYVAGQIEGLVEPLERVAGRKLDIDRLREVIDLSRQTTMLWKAVLEAATAVPAPITFFDGTIQMGPAVVLRGRQEPIDYYKLLVAELQERVAKGVAAVEGERLRIYWEGMPIWGKLSPLSNLFLNARASVVASTYCNSWVFEALDPADPFRGMARAYSSIFICRSDDQKQAYIERMAELYKIDGILYHDAKTCANNSNNRYGLPQRVQEKLGLPFLVVNGDLNDLRMYSEEQTKTNIEAFVEQLLQQA